MSPEHKHDLLAEYLLLLRKRRYRVLLITCLTFIVSFILFKLYVIKFTSSLTFIFDESDPSTIAITEEERVTLSQLNSVGRNRMYPIIFSDEMARRLNAQLSLGTHYGIRKSEPDFYAQIIKMMRKRIKISKDINRIVTVKVEDSNLEYAAHIANAIFDNLIKINRQIVRMNLQYKLSVYNSSMQSLDLQSTKDIENLNRTLAQLKNAGNAKQISDEDFLYLKSNILNIYNEATDHALDLKKEKIMSQLTIDAMQDSTIQNLYLLNRAYPQSRQQAYISSGFYSLGIAVVVGIYYVFALYFVNRNKYYFSLLFHGEPKESKVIDGKIVSEEILS